MLPRKNKPPTNPPRAEVRNPDYTLRILIDLAVALLKWLVMVVGWCASLHDVVAEP